MHPLHTLLHSQPVQWKTLGEVADYEQPTQYLVSSKDYSDDYPTPVLTAGKTFILGYTDETHGIYNASQKPVIIFDDFTTTNKWVDFDFKVKSSAMKMLTSKDESQVLLKFIYYYLNSLPSVEISDHKRQWISNFAQKRFPVLPLPLQARIVEILDNFTACNEQLTAALNKEHTLRKKQYAYYRDLLLSEAELSKVGFEWRALGEVFHIGAGGDVPKESLSPVQTEEFKYPILSNGIGENALYGWTAQAKITEPSLTVSARGTIGWTSYRDTPFFPIVRLLVLTPKIDIVLKYAYYFMKCIENSYKVPEGGIPQLTKPMIKDIAIPIPPLAHQQKIVDILDRFDTLTNSITQGLPREIELRRKQYEYYRELLLTFE